MITEEQRRLLICLIQDISDYGDCQYKLAVATIKGSYKEVYDAIDNSQLVLNSVTNRMSTLAQHLETSGQ